MKTHYYCVVLSMLAYYYHVGLVNTWEGLVRDIHLQQGVVFHNILSVCRCVYVCACVYVCVCACAHECMCL